MAILFDLDGTLIDTAPDFVATVQDLRTQLGLSTLETSAHNSIRLAVSFGTKALVRVGLKINPDHTDFSNYCDQFLDLYQQNLGSYANPFPGIIELLDTLEQRQIPWGVVTNKPSRFSEPLLKKLGLSHKAACIVSGDTTPFAKPHPQPLFHACEKMRIMPQQCIFIGDAEQDILAGKAAGMTTVGVLFGYIENPSLAKQWSADHYIQRADEILPWYEQWSLVQQSI